MPKVCEFYLRGQCRYGVKCWNLHDTETSRQRATSTKAINDHLSLCARKVAIFDKLLESLPDERPRKEPAEILESIRLFELSQMALEGTEYDSDTSIAPLQVYDHCASSAQSTSTTSTASPAQSTSTTSTASPAQSTSATSTNALIAQDHSGRLAQSTSTTSTNALTAQDHSGGLAQSTSTSTTITNALITQLRVQDNFSRPSQSTSTSTNITNSLITQVQELPSQLEASMRPTLKQPDNSKIAMEIVVSKLSVEIKKGNGDSEEEAASNSHALDQNSLWDDILMSAIDSNLLCNICFEMFIKPTVLSCSHTFCESCILTWTSRVIACPICRMEVEAKSYCLALEGFIEKIVEHLPKEMKDKREATIKERINLKTERETHRFSRGGQSELMYPLPRADAAISPPQYLMNRNVDFDEDVLYDESEIVRMNLHDTVVSTRGINPLMSYVVEQEEQTSNRRITRSYNTSNRH